MLITSFLAAAAMAGAHPDSLSSSLVEIDGDGASVRLRCQLLSLEEVIEGLDSDGDGAIEETELSERADDVRRYVESHYRVIVGADRSLEGGAALTVESFEARWLDPDERSPLGRLDSGIEFVMQLRAAAPIDELVLEVTLFHDTSPDHVDLATVRWPGGSVDAFGVMRELPRVRSDPGGRNAFGTFLRLGFDHILSGWDHLAFVALLFLGARSWRSLLGVVTAFTAAHSITLAAASLGWVDVAPFSGIVEMLIALSIAYVGCMNVIGRPSTGSRWVEAFVFGLVHGLGFAGYLARSLVGEGAKGWALFSFNVGIELGQVLAALGFAVLARTLIRGEPARGTVGLVPDHVRRYGSLPLVAAGLWWFFERV